MIGADIYNGTPAQLNSFETITGASYPLLLNGGRDAGGNFYSAYGDRDDYVVIDQHDIIRFNALTQGYVYGSRYDLSRITALVDSLIAAAVGVGDPFAPVTAQFSASPNPFRSDTKISFAAPAAAGATVRLAIFDLAGRRVVDLFDAVSATGTIDVRWDGRDATGRPAPAGVYLMRAVAGAEHHTQRIVRLQ